MTTPAPNRASENSGEGLGAVVGDAVGLIDREGSVQQSPQNVWSDGMKSVV